MYTWSLRENSKRDIGGLPARPLSLSMKVLIQISKPHICLWVVRLSCCRPAPRTLTCTFPRRIAQIIPPSLTTHRASRLAPSPPLVPTKISSFLLRRIIYRFPANYDRASIAFFSVSPARPALPLLAVTFSPSKDSRRGSSRGITAHNSLTTS